MDLLSDFLDGPRARGAFMMRVVMKPPWSMTVADQAPLTVVQHVSGLVWFRPEDGEPIMLHPGDVLVVRAVAAYTLSTEPDLPPTICIGAEQECTGNDGRDLSDSFGSAIRTWGNDPTGPDCLLVGTYLNDGEVGRLLLGALPPYLVVPSGSHELATLMNTELSTAELGQASVTDRLLDLALLSALRTWIGTCEQPPTLLTAHRDGVVADATRLMQHHPENSWTVERLAERVGVSRAAFARRFTATVGVPPMSFLAQWRLAIAADLLVDGHLTVAAVARRVGYGTPFSFSAAFKKRYGQSPQHYRERRSA